VCGVLVNGLVRQRPERRRVIWVGAIVAMDGERPIALKGAIDVKRCVDGYLLVVDAQAVPLGVRVREETGLEHRIRGGFDAWDEMRRRYRHLFDLGKVV
jgi:hypothetical protein